MYIQKDVFVSSKMVEDDVFEPGVFRSTYFAMSCY